MGKGVYYQPDHLWTRRKAIKVLDKITCIPKKDARSWLGNQALWQVHVSTSKEINHPYYDVKKSNKQHQSELL